MLNIGSGELLVILLVALIFLGPQRLPDVARQLGQAVSSLRSLASGFQAELEAASKPDHASSMTLEGPTDQAEAIAATQTKETGAGAKGWDPDEPFELVTTDPFALKDKARSLSQDMSADTPVKPVSTGGPTDLRDSAPIEGSGDEEE